MYQHHQASPGSNRANQGDIMALLDLQALEASEQTGGGDSSLSLLCGKHSSHSVLLCL
ncbi:hypothetical protein GCM10010400_35710 [Streptomyces aculeolatus]